MTDENDEQDLQVGDETVLVVTAPNNDIDRDPMAKLDGLPCFLKFEDSYEPEFGETVTVKVADVKRGSFATAVVLDKGRKDE